MAESFASLEDELITRYTPAVARKTASAALRSGLPGAQAMAEQLIRGAQRTAQREAARARRRVLESDDWLESALSFAGGQ